jgi:hypothetical protein
MTCWRGGQRAAGTLRSQLEAVAARSDRSNNLCYGAKLMVPRTADQVPLHRVLRLAHCRHSGALNECWRSTHSCLVRKYSAVGGGTGIKCWSRARPSGNGSGIPQPRLVSDPYIGLPSSNGLSYRDTAAAPLRIAPKNRSILPDRRRCRGLRACKVLARDRTKRFHVKHFGKIGQAGNEPPACGFAATYT